MIRLLRRLAPRNERGFSLIEMTIMIAVSAVLFIGLTRGLHAMIGAANQNRDYLIALNLAKRQMAIMNNAAYPAVAAETAQAADAAFPSFIPTQTVANVTTSGSNSLRLITIRIRRNSVTGAVLMRVDTYRSNIITFGDGT